MSYCPGGRGVYSHTGKDGNEQELAACGDISWATSCWTNRLGLPNAVAKQIVQLIRFGP